MSNPISLKAIRPKRFNLIDPGRTIANIKKSQKRYLEEVKRQLNAGYSDVTPSPRYTRTNKLRDGWIIEVSTDGSTGTLKNRAAHAVYAVGPRGGGRGRGERQAAFQRQRGWKSISDVARETRPRYVQLMNRSLSPHATGEI